METQSSALDSKLDDPHLQELLLKKTTTERAASRDASKLAKLVEDAKTPLYDGCDLDHIRLDVILRLLNVKAKKSTDKLLNMILEYLHELLPKGTHVDETKKIEFPLYLPPTCASMIVSFIGTSARIV